MLINVPVTDDDDKDEEGGNGWDWRKRC
jgi:hypothetical protein